ncbi:MAG: lysostaphin resistance A-like protein [bacterium]|jgi:membrane protease YdiL (CAAX protease family)
MQGKNFIQSILILLSLIIAGTLVGSILAMLLIEPILGITVMGNTEVLNIYSNNPATPMALKFFQLFQVFFSFIVPAHLFARFHSNKQSAEYLKLNSTPTIHFVLAALLIFLISPLISFLNEINQNIHLPSSMANIENTFKALEEKSKVATELFLQVNSTADFIVNFFIVAILAAVSEELIFRGVLQRLMGTVVRNIHLNIFICASIFSAFHLQFYGFLPRLALGLLLGYSFHFSKSLWVPILIHFLNNGTAVVFDLLYKRNLTSLNPNENEYFGYVGLMISLISTITLFWHWNNIYKKSIS